MTSLTNMQRKVIFALAILVLFVGMYPYKEFLHREAERRDLGEATIGEVDTGSFMLKLALLGGARGIAANVLWMRAQDLQKVQDWDKMKATVNLITKLQPHFLQIWTFQGWNLAYNVSVEWDAPEDKYEWIKQGIKFLRDGVSKNSRSPDLIWDTAWTYYHKLGFADESIILRRLFFDDSDESFKRDPIDNNIYRDNFQLAAGWFTQSIRLADSGEKRIVEGIEEEVEHVDAPVQRKGRPGDLAFRSMPAHAQTRYASSLEKESMVGIPAQFGQVAKNEWNKALNEWVTFGRFIFHNPNEIKDDSGKVITQDIQIDDSTSVNRMKVLHPNVAYWTNRWADQMNYPYWKDRCAAEMEDEGVAARQLFYEGTKAYKAADLPKAVKNFEEGLRIWESLLKKHPNYNNDDLNKKDTGMIVKRYARACQQLGVPVPKDTPFLDLLKYVEGDNTVDPFDALEMTSKPATGPAPVAPGGNNPPQGQPAPGQAPQAK
jgi:hypothetical protein